MKDSIEYIATKSKELLSNQIDSYRSLHQKSAVLIAITAIFIPLFLFLIENSGFWIKISAAILIIPMIVGIILLILTLSARTLNQGYDESCFEDLINVKLKQIHKTEIAYNKYSIEQNDVILKSQNKKYNNGLKLIIIAIIFSICLMLAHTIFSNNKNSKTDISMAKKDNSSSSANDRVKKETLPKVNPNKVKQLNEGIEPKKKNKEVE